jgi:hypothetical protein
VLGLLVYYFYSRKRSEFCKDADAIKE